MWAGRDCFQVLTTMILPRYWVAPSLRVIEGRHHRLDSLALAYPDLQPLQHPQELQP
jgi:hypothetical protein